PSLTQGLGCNHCLRAPLPRAGRSRTADLPKTPRSSPPASWAHRGCARLAVLLAPATKGTHAARNIPTARGRDDDSKPADRPDKKNYCRRAIGGGERRRGSVAGKRPTTAGAADAGAPPFDPHAVRSKGGQHGGSDVHRHGCGRAASVALQPCGDQGGARRAARPAGRSEEAETAAAA